MVYGSEAILPTDLDYGASTIRAYDEKGAKATHEDTMDQLGEACDIALLRSAKYQQALRWYHGQRVRDRAFNVGDLVLCLVQSNKDHHKALPTLGGAVRRHGSTLSRCIQVENHQRQGLHQCLEHQTATSFLPLNKCILFLISFCLYKSPIFSDIRPLQIARGQTSLGG